MDVRWLFKFHRAHCSRKQLLDYLIDQAEKENFEESKDDLIESLVFARRPLDEPRHAGSQLSRTEYIALNLDNEKQRIKADYESALRQWKKERAELDFYIVLYKSIFSSLTEEERAFIILYFQENYSIETIAQMPLTKRAPGPRSKSTLRRMLQKIIQKAQKLAEIQIDKI